MKLESFVRILLFEPLNLVFSRQCRLMMIRHCANLRFSSTRIKELKPIAYYELVSKTH
jgi:hypothetical protein